MARNNQRGSKNNNPEGRNQFSNGWVDSARDRPVAAAAAAAAAVGAGVFLWSRRNQISDQISNLSDQFSEWAGNQQFGSTQSGSTSGDLEFADTGVAPSTGASASTSRASGGRSSRGKAGQSGQGFGGTTGRGGTTTTTGGGTTGSGGTAF